MSRTYRKHSINICWVDKNEYWSIGYAEFRASQENISVEKFKQQERARFRTRTRGYYDYTLPHDYRNQINRQRRAKDRNALHNEIYEKRFPDYATWNCKDSNSWGYW